MIHRISQEVLVAVSGHRQLAEPASVAQAMEQAMRWALQCFHAEHLCVLTSLAEGADRMVIEAARAVSPSRFVAVLPMAAAEYRHDFDSDSAKSFDQLLAAADSVQVLESSSDRDEAYFQAGVAVLEQCDVLLAAWDGEPALGHGGTAEIVALARERGTPLAWVQTTRPGQEGMSAGEKANIRYERFPVESRDDKVV